MSPLLSVAVVTYNQKDFLKACLASIMQQQFNDWEIIIADDCSNDGTAELLASYAIDYPGLFRVVLEREHRGPTATSNAALFACEGKYIAWMDGDDLMLPGKLKKQVDYLEANPRCAICYHNMEVFDSESGRRLGYWNSGFRSITPHQGRVDALIHECFMLTSSIITRRSACPSTGYDERLPVVSDWLFYIETAMNGEIGYIPETLGRYRRHKANISTDPGFADREWPLTLGIIESKYPWFVRHTRRSRARFLKGLGARQLLLNQITFGRKYLIESLRLEPLAWRTMALLLLSLLNYDVLKRIYSRRFEKISSL